MDHAANDGTEFIVPLIPGGTFSYRTAPSFGASHKRNRTEPAPRQRVFFAEVKIGK
jgi:hypothetical protein